MLGIVDTHIPPSSLHLSMLPSNRIGPVTHLSCQLQGFTATKDAVVRAVLSGDGFVFRKVPTTPWKINMEPENHLFEKENHLQNLPFLGSMLIFRGVRTGGVIPSKRCLKLVNLIDYFTQKKIRREKKRAWIVNSPMEMSKVIRKPPIPFHLSRAHLEATPKKTNRSSLVVWTKTTQWSQPQAHINRTLQSPPTLPMCAMAILWMAAACPFTWPISWCLWGSDGCWKF